MIDECNMCHPQMKAPTFATLQPNFMRNFQSKMPDLVCQPLTLPLLVTVCLEPSTTTEGNAHVFYFFTRLSLRFLRRAGKQRFT